MRNAETFEGSGQGGYGKLRGCIGRSLLLAMMASGVAVAEPPAEDRPLVRGFLSGAAPLTGPLVTDRPDATESTEPVPYGRLQLEMGYTFTIDKERGQRLYDHTAPELLLRIGVAERVELRLGWEGYSWSRHTTTVRDSEGRRRVKDWDQGAHDLTLGVKVKLLDQHDWRPDFGVIVEASVPSGGGRQTSGDVDPNVLFLWAYTLSESMSLGGSLGVGAPTEEGDRFVQASSSIALGIALTEVVGTYVEYHGLYPNRDGGDCAHYLSGGFTFLVHDNLQFDLRAGFGLNREADDFFAGVGLAFRL